MKQLTVQIRTGASAHPESKKLIIYPSIGKTIKRGLHQRSSLGINTLKTGRDMVTD
jgi:hypothetical protein